ncbi:MAG: hypothetical protein GY716_17895, partial [bacterium]|nr:hypothetical protein [bacterium]
KSWVIEIGDATRTPGHHGRYHVGRLSASRPARLERSEPLQLSSVEGAGRSDAIEGQSRVEVPSVPVERPTGPLSSAEQRLQGRWQSYDFASNSRAWKMTFDGREFHAEGGGDDWYTGFITLRSDEDPAWLDFTIEDCLCSYKGTTSHGIYSWDGDSIVVAAPQPGKIRPERFVQNRGDMLRLLPLDGD